MTKLHINNAIELAKIGRETDVHPSNWNGAYGLIVDKSYRLSDGSILDLTCLNGWIYEGRLYSKKEVKELSHRCPQNVHMEWGSGY